MKLPAISGVIARRLLLNFRCEPEIVARLLPAPFRPKLHGEFAIAGVCLIRLEKLQPAACSLPFGSSSENAAHRVAVEWDENGRTREGVFIPRRDTDSLLNSLAGGRIFSGEHHRARFQIEDDGENINFQMRSCDGAVEVRVRGHVAPALPATSCFADLGSASRFFENGCVGYSRRSSGNALDGMRLQVENWRVAALDVSEIFSSWLDDETKFPKGSAVFDHALLMRDITHQWHEVGEMGE